MPAESSFLQSPRARSALAMFVLVIAGAAVYANSLSGEFVFDDVRIIEHNQHLDSLSQAWQTGGGRRVALVTFAANRALHGDDVFGYHAANVAIHIVTGLLLFALVQTTLAWPTIEERFRSHATALAFAIALLWMVHPLTTQAVAYITQRMESLMAMFLLATLLTFAIGAGRNRSWSWYIVSVACCGLGMMTKQVMAVTPLLVLWYDRAYVASSWIELARRRWPLYVGLFATWLLFNWRWTRLLFAEPEAAGGGRTAVQVEGLTPWTYLLSQAGVLVHYLRLCFWPSGQTLDYGWPPVDSFGDAVLPGLLIVGLLGLTIWAMYYHPRWSFLGGCFFLILGPTSSVIPIADLAVEHRMYLPLAAVLTAATLALYLVYRKLLPTSNEATASRVLLVTAVVLSVVLGITTIARNQVWRNEVALWQDVVKKAPDNWRGRFNLTAALLETQRYRDVIREGKQFLNDVEGNQLGQYDYVRSAMVHVGIAYSRLNETQQAVPYFEKALAMDPEDPKAHLNLGKALRESEPAAAIAHFEQAIEHDPNYADAYNNLGAMVTQSNPEQARRLFEKSLELDPYSADAHNNMANLLARQGELERAIVHYNRALDIRPGFAFAQRNRAIVVERHNAQRGLQ